MNALRFPFAVALFFIASLNAEGFSDLVGQATVVDGDTLEIHGERIRIFGIDAPESSQLCRGGDSLRYRCGASAADALSRFIERQVVTCVPLGFDRYRRKVAKCSVNNIDISEWLVRNGYALDWPKYSRGAYAEAQTKAAHEELGVWSGRMTAPWVYRNCMKQNPNIEACSDL